MGKKRRSTKSALAIHGGKPLYTKPWRSGNFHFGAELSALERVLAGPALPLARGKQVQEKAKAQLERDGAYRVMRPITYAGTEGKKRHKIKDPTWGAKIHRVDHFQGGYVLIPRATSTLSRK